FTTRTRCWVGCQRFGYRTESSSRFTIEDDARGAHSDLQPDSGPQEGSLDTQLGEVEPVAPQRRREPEKGLEEQAERVFGAARFTHGEEQARAEPESHVEVTVDVLGCTDYAHDAEHANGGADPG